LSHFLRLRSLTMANTMIVRHTFIEFEKASHADENVFCEKRRSRTWTDTAIEYDIECDRKSSSASTTDASQAGDLTPNSTSDVSLNLEEVEAALECHAQTLETQATTPKVPPGVLSAAMMVPPAMTFAPQMQMYLVPIATSIAAVPIQFGIAQEKTVKAQTTKGQGSHNLQKHRSANISSHQWPSHCKQAPPQHAAVSAGESRTTLMLRNLPSCFTRAKLLKMIESQGLSGHLDFVYLPIDFLSGAGLGYAFVNMCTPQDAQMAAAKLRGLNDWMDSTSNKVLDVCWSDPHQGIEMLIERYRNSRVMHGTVPDHYKPMLFSEGRRVPFPAPTKRVRPPFSSNQ